MREPHDELALDAPTTGWRALFPPAHWFPRYRGSWLRQDLAAGITLVAYAIPSRLPMRLSRACRRSTASTSYLDGGIAYVFLGSSRQLAIGPTSAISMLMGTTVAGMAGGDAAHGAQIAALTALLLALVSLHAWALRLSSLVNFISETILLGFKAGAALTIAMTQLPKLFGVAGGGDHFFERMWILGAQLPDTRPVILAFGIIAIALLVAGDRLFQARPVALAVVVPPSSPSR